MKCETYNQFSVLCQACNYPQKIACSKKVEETSAESNATPWEGLYSKYPADREDMSDEQEREFVNECYELYEKEGFAKTFRSNSGDMGEYHKKPFKVVERLSDLNEAHCVDLCVLPMWKIEFEDGKQRSSYPEEIILEEMKRQGWVWE